MRYDETEVYLRNPLKEDTRIITQKLNKFDVEFRITGKICSVFFICNCHCHCYIQGKCICHEKCCCFKIWNVAIEKKLR